MTEAHQTADESIRKAGGPESPLPKADSPTAAAKPRKSFEIDIFRGWCKSCGICAAFCPRQCIGVDQDGSPEVVSSDRCTGCGWCELHCPDFAISVHPKKKKRPVEDEEE